MHVAERCVYYDLRRSRKGAWIEIDVTSIDDPSFYVAPVRERGLKFITEPFVIDEIIVAPVRERGLKYQS